MHPRSYFKRSTLIRAAIALVLVAPAAARQSTSPPAPTPEVRAALERISSDSMRGHLSFLASDLLQGRNTPSPGLDLAAEYIAAQFRRAGLEPVGDEGYFQTSNWISAERKPSDITLRLKSGNDEFTAEGGKASVNFMDAFTLQTTSVWKAEMKDGATAPTAAGVAGKAVILEMPASVLSPAGVLNGIVALRPAIIVLIDRTRTAAPSAGARLTEATGRSSAPATRTLTLYGSAAGTLYDALPPGAFDASFDLAVASAEKPVKLRNVVGLLRGSDPILKDTYVLVTAHYDHIGVRETAGGANRDSIYNGANDDGSGTVSVIEIASALATLKDRPKRSILFMTVFGEEKGMLGSSYYGRHPIFPVEKTVADINLEQVGRTDSTEGPQIENASMTGFDFSDLGPIFQAAGEFTGIRVYKHARNSDSYFGRSDNAALASLGVPAHTLCVAFDYPDYHGAGDHWEKVDYVNMAKVDRMVALGVVTIANSPAEPRWNESLPTVARYVAAWKRLRGQ